MPSTKKVMHFLSSAFLQAGGVAVLGYGMSTDWVQSSMDCGPSGTNRYEGSATVQMGLFNGTEDKISCPRFNSKDIITVFEKLQVIGGVGMVLQVLVVALLVVALLGSAGSLLITLYNSFSNPYQTCMGPVGLFTCSGLSVSLAFLALVLYLINMFVVNIGQKLVQLTPDASVQNEKIQFLLGFYLLLPYMFLNLLSILLVYLYVHAAYTQRREQEKPTEDAPKDIMMF